MASISRSSALLSSSRKRIICSARQIARLHGVERHEEAERQDERLRDEPVIDQGRERGVQRTAGPD